MAVPLDSRAAVFFASVGIAVVLRTAARLLPRPAGKRWLRSLAKGLLVFGLVFFLETTVAAFVPFLLERVELGWAGRLLHDPLASIPFAVIAAALAVGAFWDSYHHERHDG